VNIRDQEIKLPQDRSKVLASAIRGHQDQWKYGSEWNVRGTGSSGLTGTNRSSEESKVRTSGSVQESSGKNIRGSTWKYRTSSGCWGVLTGHQRSSGSAESRSSIRDPQQKCRVIRNVTTCTESSTGQVDVFR
jgi:hypothetical protein